MTATFKGAEQQKGLLKKRDKEDNKGEKKTMSKHLNILSKN